MSEPLQTALDGIRWRAEDAEQGRSDDYVKWSQEDVPSLLAAVEWTQKTHGIDDPCSPRRCSHADCEITNGLTHHLGRRP